MEEEQVPQEGQVKVYETSQDWEEEYETQYAEMEPPIGVIRCTLTKVNENIGVGPLSFTPSSR